MTPLLQIVAWATVLTWIAVMSGAILRNREWTLAGMKIGLGNRENLREPTPLGGRAVRAASNTLENFVLFVALALTAHAAGADEAATLGAQLFLWARVVYLLVYWAGIPVLRTVVYGFGTAGLAMMLLAVI